MRPTIGVAALLFVWLIISYILVGLMGISISYGFGTYHPLAFLQYDALGKAAMWTTKWVYEILVVLLVLILGSFWTNPKGLFTFLVFGEVFALFLSYGVIH